MKLKRRILCFVLVFTMIFSSGFGVFAQQEPSFDEMLAQLRQERFAPPMGMRGRGGELPQVFIDTSDVVHTTPEMIQLPLPQDTGNMGFAPAFSPIPFNQGDTRMFRSPNQVGTLSRQGSRVNIWTMSTSVAGQIDDAMVAHFDNIVNSMEESFAPFAGVRVHTPWTAQMPVVGDVHGDGRVNVLIHNHTGGGFFASADYNISVNAQPIALFHVSSDFINNRDILYNIFAHEFQHLLFHMHFSVYTLVQGAAVTSEQFLWFNEALSELAGFLYANPGSETISVGRGFSAAENSYANPYDARIGDFVNFNNSLKAYAMMKFYGIHLHRATPAFTRAVFDYFRDTFPVTDSFIDNFHRTQSMGMQTIVGNALHAAGLTGSTGATGVNAHNLNYFLFMEAFAADGGSVAGYSVTPFINSPYSAHRFWGIRPHLGVPALAGQGGRYGVFFDSTSISFHDLGGRQAFPLLSTGGSVSLAGFQGGGSAPQTHNATLEKFYRLTPHTPNNRVLNIQISDNNPYTFFYVVIPNDLPGSVSDMSNRTLGSQGARVYPITANTENFIDTGGQTAYLFVATLYRNVSTAVTYDWTNQLPATPRTWNASVNGIGELVSITDTADIGEPVTLTLNPIAGYNLSSINILGADINQATVTHNLTERTITFIMPDGTGDLDVTVSPVWVFANVPPTGVADITGLMAAMLALAVISAALWSVSLHKKTRSDVHA